MPRCLPNQYQPEAPARDIVAPRWRFGLISVFLALTCLIGCSPSGPRVYVVRGKIHDKGVPLELKNVAGQILGGVQVWLIKEGTNPPEKKQATVRPDGSFIFLEGSQPTEGRYKVTVNWQDDYPLGPDKLEGKFNEKNSKLIWEIPTQLEFEIDVSRSGG